MAHQVEIYFSEIQRTVLTPKDFADLAEVESRLLAFERRYEETAKRLATTFRSDVPSRADSYRGSPSPTRRSAKAPVGGVPDDTVGTRARSTL